MDNTILVRGLLDYLYLVLLLTFHEYAHAWAALKLGDNTAQTQGRVSLNPAAHMDFWGTLVFPLFFVFLLAAGSGVRLFFGWAKPVPVNPDNLPRPQMDSILIALAGPAMNLLLAAAIMALVKLAIVTDIKLMHHAATRMVQISLILAFFNLLPIPPLDGSYVLKYLLRMSDTVFFRAGLAGFFLVLGLVQLPWVRHGLKSSVESAELYFKVLYGI